MFKVGDKVVGISSGVYSITIKGWIGIVTEVRGREIKVVDPDKPEERFLVESKYFKLLEEPKVEEPEIVFITDSLYV